MLTITIEGSEGWDDLKQEFVKTSKDCTISLEHSLVSISKWEAKYHKPYLSEDKKTREEIIFYVKCMTITQNVDDSVYDRLTSQNLKEIFEYIENPMSATVFYDYGQQKRGRVKNRVPTSETIYSYMVGLNIPIKCEKWHLNRLLNLIRICSDNSNPNKKKMSKREILERNKRLNDERLKKLNTKG